MCEGGWNLDSMKSLHLVRPVLCWVEVSHWTCQSAGNFARVFVHRCSDPAAKLIHQRCCSLDSHCSPQSVHTISLHANASGSQKRSV